MRHVGILLRGLLNVAKMWGAVVLFTAPLWGTFTLVYWFTKDPNVSFVAVFVVIFLALAYAAGMEDDY